MLLIYKTAHQQKVHKRNASCTATHGEFIETDESPNKGSPSTTNNLMNDKVEEISSTNGFVEQRCNREKIADFVTKLGFLDAEKIGRHTVRTFLHLNSVSLLELTKCRHDISMIILGC